MTARPLHHRDQRGVIVFHQGEEVDLPSADIDRGLVDVIPAPLVESLDPGMAPPTEDQCGLVDVLVVRDKNSAGPGQGFDLAKITLSDAALLERSMRIDGIDPAAPNARQQYSRYLYRMERKGRSGRKFDDLRTVIEMASAGVTDGDTAPVAARKVAEYYNRPASVKNLTQKIRRHRRKYLSG